MLAAVDADWKFLDLVRVNQIGNGVRLVGTVPERRFFPQFRGRIATRGTCRGCDSGYANRSNHSGVRNSACHPGVSRDIPLFSFCDNVNLGGHGCDGELFQLGGTRYSLIERFFTEQASVSAVQVDTLCRKRRTHAVAVKANYGWDMQPRA